MTLDIRTLTFSTAQSNRVKRTSLNMFKLEIQKKPILLLYDGHRSHIFISLIQWARQKNIMLFVLPPHTNYLLLPLDVVYFGPFEKSISTGSSLFMRLSVGRSVTRYDICRLACKVYGVAPRSQNLRPAFRKTGIYPLNPSSISKVKTLASLVYIGNTEITSN